MTVSSAGQIKKTPVNNWQVERNNKVMTAMNLGKGAEMINAFIAYSNQQILMVSKDGYSYALRLKIFQPQVLSLRVLRQ